MSDNPGNYGTFHFEGKEIVLREQATFSNRVFPYSYTVVKDGDPYITEYKARGYLNGKKVIVTWHFDDVKGEEPESEDEYPFDDAHIYSVEVE